MENTRKKTKTIRIKYPAQYSPQPSAKADVGGVTPRPSKRKTRASSYSAQSWMGTENQANRQTGKKAMRRASSRQVSSSPSNRKNRKNSTRPRPSRRQTPLSAPRPPNYCRPPIKRLDPSAPHLKYGLFPNRKPSEGFGNETSAAAISKSVYNRNSLIMGRNSGISGRNSVIMRRKTSPKQQKTSELADSDGRSSGAPTLVYRSHSRPPRLLAASAVSHMDIKPGRYRIASPRLPRITVF